MTAPADWLAIDWVLAAIAGWIAIGAAGVLRPHNFYVVARVLFPLGAALFLPMLFAGALPASASTVVISQIYGGAGGTYRNDFIELHNRGTTSVNLVGWSVQYKGGLSTAGAWTKTDITATSSSMGVIQPGGYFLIQEAAGTGGTTDLPSSRGMKAWK